jgi:hypothetical protein
LTNRVVGNQSLSMKRASRAMVVVVVAAAGGAAADGELSRGKRRLRGMKRALSQRARTRILISIAMKSSSWMRMSSIRPRRAGSGQSAGGGGAGTANPKAMHGVASVRGGTGSAAIWKPAKANAASNVKRAGEKASGGTTSGAMKIVVTTIAVEAVLGVVVASVLPRRANKPVILAAKNAVNAVRRAISGLAADAAGRPTMN